MIGDALESLAQVVSPRYRSVFWKTIGLTLVLLVLAVVGLDALLARAIPVATPWVATLLSVLAGLGLFVGAIFLVGPASSIVASLYLDDLAEGAERTIRPDGPIGLALPVGQALRIGLRFAVLALAVNLLALMALLVPGLNAVAFLLANGYLLGRAFFELAAMRFMPVAQANALRRRHAGTVFFGGLLIAGFVAVPLVNLATPLFGTALMVRINRRLIDREARAKG